MKKRILIVDDDTSIRNGLKKLLKKANYDVALAADGIEAVDRFFSEPIDLLLLDLNMPGKDDAPSVPSTKFVSNGGNRKRSTISDRSSWTPRPTADGLVAAG